MVRLLRHSRFGWFWTGQTISRFGDACSAVALGWLILDMTNSAAALGMAMLFVTLPEVLFALVGGMIIDRYDLRKLMISTDIALGALTAGIWVMHATDHLHMWHIYVYALLYGTVQAVFAPIYLSAVPRLVNAADMDNANRLLGASEQTIFLLGAPAAGFLIAWLGAAPVFALDSLSFLLSAACGLAMRGPLPPESDPQESVWGSLSSTFAYIRERPSVLGLLMLRSVGNVGYAPFAVLLVVWVRQFAHGGPELYGLLSTALCIGGLMGTLMRMPKRWSTGQLILGTNALLGAAIVLFALVPWWWLGFVLAPLIGFLETAEILLVNLAYQHLVEAGYLGRIGSIRVLVTQGFYAAGKGLGGWLGALAGVGPAMAVGGCILGLSSGLVRLTTPVASIQADEATAAQS